MSKEIEMSDLEEKLKQAMAPPSVPDCFAVGAQNEAQCEPQRPTRLTVKDSLRREQHDLIQRLAEVHQALKDIDNIPEHAIEFFRKFRYHF